MQPIDDILFVVRYPLLQSSLKYAVVRLKFHYYNEFLQCVPQSFERFLNSLFTFQMFIYGFSSNLPILQNYFVFALLVLHNVGDRPFHLLW